MVTPLSLRMEERCTPKAQYTILLPHMSALKGTNSTRRFQHEHVLPAGSGQTKTLDAVSY